MAKNKHLVLAFFKDEASADKAVADLKAWDKATKSVKLGSIGVMVKDAKGKVKTHKLGTRAYGRGAGIGVILGLIAAVPTGGLSLLAGGAWGAVGGAIVGTFFHNGLGISKDDLKRISKQLDGGKAAVGVLCEEKEVQEVSDKLTASGGKVETHAVTEEALAQATAVADAAPKAVPAAPPPAPEPPPAPVPAPAAEQQA